jgi:UDP-2,3-diacylglucosamine hydrolase
VVRSPTVPALAATTRRIALADPVFVSDLHLSTNTPRTLAAFVAFVRDVAAHRAELLILGDLFEYWTGDDDSDTAAAAVVDALAGLSRRGKRVCLMHGNRDLLLGLDFCASAGATLLTDPTLADIAGIADSATLLSHGDAWCTGDKAYQQFRSQVRDPEWQRAFLAQDREARRAFVGRARAASESAKQVKAADIMDVTPAEVDAAFATHDVNRIIHGHTHRPATHRHTLGGMIRERWVLPDWDFDRDFDGGAPRGGYLRVAGGEFVVEAVAAP